MSNSKKRKSFAIDKSQQNITVFFSKKATACSSHENLENIPPPGGTLTSQIEKPSPFKVKEDNGQDSVSQHSHSFTVKFGPSDRREYTVYCDRPKTVLEAIKSLEATKKKLKSSDENLVIQLGREDKDTIVPTHFPCSCLGNGEVVSILCKSEMIEKSKTQQQRRFHANDKLTVFYIDTVGGLNAKTKEIFHSNIVKKYKRLCVYGEKGMSVAEVLRRDGRFSDHLGDFSLSNNENPNSLTHCTQTVNDSLDQKTFKIQLAKRLSDTSLQESPLISTQYMGAKRSPADIAEQCGKSVRAAIEKQGEDVDNTEIYSLLRKQFPQLREWMENRFPDDSYQTELELRKQNFGNIQKSFREVHRVRKLLKLGESVCKITVGDHCQGTGFVLFDRLILTNAHLFTNHVDEDKKQLDEGIEVCALFNYEEPMPKSSFYFKAEKRLVDFDRNLDYAILKLNPEGLKSNQERSTSLKVPPGLLWKFGPLPENGEACIIGHPAGAVKEMHPTFVVQKENRMKAIDDHLGIHKHNPFMLFTVQQILIGKGIENIMLGNKAGDIMTYNTFMYHGSSGSPVFDGLGRVVGLHTAGYDYEFLKQEHHVIEFAHSLLVIFQSFVRNLKKNREHRRLLEKVREIAKGNRSLRGILGAELSDDEEETVGKQGQSSTPLAKRMRC